MQVAPLRALIALVLVAITLVSGGWSFPRSPQAGGIPQVATAGRGSLQEVAAPAAVQQIAARLSTTPRVEITAPADDALLPDGPWNLELRVSDWPLSDGDELGQGPHVVVQLDQQPPLRLGRRSAEGPIPMPALQPGSHRLTVYAARPWGEAVKSPGAYSQIRLHRVGRNPAELPARGSAQLIATSPDGLQHQEPVLIDWLLLDAPLQHLRDDDTRWRLRISVNGDSFLVDRQTPIWLQGFRRGSNAVQLELLDGRGDPLNPPFNSLVREVVIDGSERPAWQRSNLTARELAMLSGAAPPADHPEPAAATPPPMPAEPTKPVAEGEPGLSHGEAQAAHNEAEAEAAEEGDDAGHAGPLTSRQTPPPKELKAESARTTTPPSEGPTPSPAALEEAEPDSAAMADEDPLVMAEPPRSATSRPEDSRAREVGSVAGRSAAAGATASGGANPPDIRSQTESSDPSGQRRAGSATEPSGAADSSPAAADRTDPAPRSDGEQAEPGKLQSGSNAPAAETGPLPQERVSPGSSLGGSARDQVNADGSLVQPRRRGPLAGLREKLGG
jgi:hypothetical protein